MSKLTCPTCGGPVKVTETLRPTYIVGPTKHLTYRHDTSEVERLKGQLAKAVEFLIAECVCLVDHGKDRCGMDAEPPSTRTVLCEKTYALLAELARNEAAN